MPKQRPPKTRKGKHFFNLINLSQATPEQRRKIIADLIERMDEADKAKDQAAAQDIATVDTERKETPPE